MVDYFGAEIRCIGCEYACDVTAETMASLKFEVKKRCKACGFQVARFYPYRSDNRKRTLLLNTIVGMPKHTFTDELLEDLSGIELQGRALDLMQEDIELVRDLYFNQEKNKEKCSRHMTILNLLEDIATEVEKRGVTN